MRVFLVAFFLSSPVGGRVVIIASSISATRFRAALSLVDSRLLDEHDRQCSIFQRSNVSFRSTL